MLRCCERPSFLSEEAQAFRVCESCGADVSAGTIRSWVRYHEMPRKAREFHSLLRGAAHYYAVPGVLDPDDLYQQGLVLLDRMFTQRDLYPDSPDFRKLFKTELWHGLSNQCGKERAQCRDWRRRISETQGELGADDEYTLWDLLPAPALTPEAALEWAQSAQRVQAFLADMYLVLDPAGRALLQELMEPTEVEAAVLATYQRVPSKPSTQMLARKLHWSQTRVKRVLATIREHARRLVHVHALDPAGVYC